MFCGMTAFPFKIREVEYWLIKKYVCKTTCTLYVYMEK